MAELVSAAAEYAKDARLKPSDIAQLREWLRKQPHLPQYVSDEFLIAILHSSEYSIEQAKQLLETNITCRTNYTEFFSNRDPLAKDHQAVWDFLDLWVSFKTTNEKYRIFFGGLSNCDPNLFDFPALLGVFVNVLDSTVREKGVCPGYVIVLNCRGVTLTHLAKANVSYIRNILHYIQEAICIKMKAIHVINVSPIIDKIMFIVKPFLKKELLDILYFHSGEMENFYKAVPQDLLPQEIGGTMGHKQELVDITRSRVERMRDWLIDEEKLTIDRSKQTNQKDDIYSVAGSFRKLELD